ncbi:lysozyme [Dyadobacter aurulentus]|uniref:lysozyme n=1 Tax=Dyadobacter sp. UC 10 TaxID=2605428 RepID=UPI0011F107D6|nr:lysozyme [Dyadobacter sp. UC 10]KAA0992775.1 lysozyme [Dyadobacter sp. UC 10]
MANLTVQNSTLNFLADVEGFIPVAKWDYKQWSIGYGTGIMPNGRPVKAGDTVTKAEAWQMLIRDAPLRGASVNRYVTSNINQNQFDALVSFVYNFGAGALADSTLLKRVNENPLNYQAISTEFRKWINAGGVPQQGLIDRREKEIRLYESGSVAPTNFIWLILIGAFMFLALKK